MSPSSVWVTFSLPVRPSPHVNFCTKHLAHGRLTAVDADQLRPVVETTHVEFLEEEIKVVAVVVLSTQFN